AQLPDLNVLVHVVEPLAHALHDVRLWPVNRVFQLSTRGHADFIRRVELGVDAVQATCNAPEAVYFLDIECGCGHVSLKKLSRKSISSLCCGARQTCALLSNQRL